MKSILNVKNLRQNKAVITIFKKIKCKLKLINKKCDLILFTFTQKL